jgi:transcriptional regulator with XRE-family HTH domain
MTLNVIDRNKLCSDLGIKYTTLCDWLNAKTYPRIDKIEMMANYFGVQKADLVEDRMTRQIIKLFSGMPSDWPEGYSVSYDEELKEKDTTEPYYLNDDARDMAQFMFENPEYKVLFDASRKVKKEDIQFVKEMIDRLSTRD